MKLFGSKKALMNERLRQKESGLLIIHPCSTFRYVFCFFFILAEQNAAISNRYHKEDVQNWLNTVKILL